ncbi:MAG: glycoside hydrolase family 127 protein [Bacteroidetes bacterium]|nr:glycoside hydrolase family 127 protein [Bacteroidota bacterium]MBS1540409.1 glycoside hydrolase family 127 protein [Bacteroidota bacterium]
MKLIIALTIALLAIGCVKQKPVINSPFDNVGAIEERYQLLPITEIKPAGWLQKQIQENLDGFTGRLDTLVPKLIMDDKIYGKDRLTSKIKNKNVGALGAGGDWQVQFLWWNSETQSNWRDGYIRSAILANDQAHLQKIKMYIDYILSTQDEDGYLGIYDKDLRYHFDNENGELWAKSTLLRGLLAWYEYTGDKKILKAIEQAAKNVMDNYPINSSHPFYSKQPNVGGTSHGLTITDVFESLYRITGNKNYRDYILFLYKDFSEQTLNEDAQYKKLMNDTLLLKGHGVHTYEHLRSLAAAYYASGNPHLKNSIDKFLMKIGKKTTASGAGVGDEWIGGRLANATQRGYEYCSLHELMHSYLSLVLKSGDKSFADKAEKIFFNAAQGARHPQKSCIAYLKSDNSYSMTGGLNGHNTDKSQTRYTYSPVHQEAAVCCVPNAGRIAPYYVQHMWLKNNDDILAALLGPSALSTSIHNKPITIKEQTNYPFGNTIRFEVTADAKFALKIRKPDWVTGFTLSEAYTEENGFIVINKAWKGTHTIELTFKTEVVVRQDINHENYFTFGVLVLANPIEAVEEQGKSFPVRGYYNYKYAPQNLVVYKYANEKVAADPVRLQFKTVLLNSATQQKDSVKLVPMANTILRQVTFQ